MSLQTNKKSEKFCVTFDEGDNIVTLEGFQLSNTVKDLYKQYSKARCGNDSDSTYTIFKFTIVYSKQALTKEYFHIVK